MTTNQEATHGLCITASGKICDQQQCKSAQTLSSSVNSTTVTAYYSNNQDTDSPPHFNLSTIPSPHVVGTLASQSPLPYMRKMPLCKSWKKTKISPNITNRTQLTIKKQSLHPAKPTHVISALAPHLQQLLPAHQNIITATALASSFHSCVSHPNGFTFQPK
jgi:hypothetical protein